MITTDKFTPPALICHSSRDVIYLTVGFASEKSMKKPKEGIRMALFCLLLLALAPVCRAQEPSSNVSQLAFRNTDFAVSLYRCLSRRHDGNIFFSPLSVSTAFATLAEGSRGPTREQILRGLNLDLLGRPEEAELVPTLFRRLRANITQDGSPRLDQGTALFVNRSFQVEEAFGEKVRAFFDADVHDVDFGRRRESLAAINEYIRTRTGGQMKEVVSHVEPLTKLIMINTIFFQGVWREPFNPNFTETDRFYVDNYNIVQVPMMFRKGAHYTMTDQQLKAKVLKLPYRGGVSMLILLPGKDSDYTAVDDEINADRFLGWIRELKKTKIDLQFPKFKLEQSYDMHKILPELGIADIFQGAANLTGLSKDPGLKVSEVLHKAVMEVDERGTTAAAATTVGITGHSLPRLFIVNRPFFFFIYHEATNSLLFMGRVIDPTKK